MCVFHTAPQHQDDCAVSGLAYIILPLSACIERRRFLPGVRLSFDGRTLGREGAWWYRVPLQSVGRCRVMPPRTFSEQWEALRLRYTRFRSWLGTPERTHSLLLLLWPLVALVIAVLVIRAVSTAKELADLISA